MKAAEKRAAWWSDPAVLAIGYEVPKLIGWRKLTPLRSEERRVGKECRSRCDWSSDVCSSDLDEGGRKACGVVERSCGPRDWLRSSKTYRLAQAHTAEIGRASCRERV